MYGVPDLSEPTATSFRVVEAFDINVPLTIVRAPSGSGKSVQMAHWARSLSSTSGVVWIDLRESSLPPLDQLRFHMDLSQRHETIIIFDNVASLVERDPSGDLLSDFERNLVSWIASMSRVRVFLVTKIVLELETQLSSLPFNTSFVGKNDLALTAEEIDGIGSDHGYPSSLIHAEAIRQASEGMPGPAQQYYSAFDPLDAQQHSLFIRSNPHDSVGSLLAPQILNYLSGVSGPLLPEVVEVITSTRRADPNVVLEILSRSGKSGTPNVLEIEECIAALELAGYLDGKKVAGVIEYGVPRPWAAALRWAFPSDPDAVNEILKASAIWCLDKGNAIDALLLAIQADDLDLAGEVTFRRSADMESSDPELWVSQIVKQGMRRLSDHPLLLMQAALGDFVRRGFEGTDPGFFVSAARSARRSESLGVGRRGSIARAGLAVIEAYAEHLGGSPTAALRSAGTSLELIKKLTHDHRHSISGALPVWLIQIGQIFLDAGKLATAESCFRQATSVATGYMNLPARFHSQGLLSLVLAHDGRMDEASQLIAEIEHYGWPSDFFVGHMGDALRLAKALVHLERNELSMATEWMTAVVSAESKAKHRYSCAVVAAMLNHMLSASAQPLLSKQPRIDDSRQRPVEILSEISASRAFRAVMTGRAPLALDLLKDVELETDFVRLVRLRLALSQSSDHDFVKQLKPASHGIAQRWQLAACLLQVVYALKIDDREAALSLLVPTLNTLRDQDLRTPWMVLTSEEQDAVRTLLENQDIHHLEIPCFSWHEPALLLEALTYRERHTLDKLVEFTSTKDIAAELFVSVNTAKTHLRSIYRKLGAKSRNQALVRASSLGLVKSRED